ncbi:MAG: hypothetical protein ACI8W8_003688, partial [Rhodothermales bacterium]
MTDYSSMKMRYSTALFAVLFLTAGQSFAALIAYEDFESYTAGNQVVGENGGTGWNAAWQVEPGQETAVTTESAALSYSLGSVVVNGGGNVMRYVANNSTPDPLLSREFAPGQSGTVYLSFLYQDAVAVGNDDFIQLGLHDNDLNNPLTTALDRNGNFQVRSGISNTSDTGIPTVTGQTYFLVLKIENSGGNYNNVSVFVNPTSAAEGVADAVNTTDSGLASATHFAVRKANHEAGDTVYVDEIRVGTTWEDVVPSVVSPTIYEDFESYTAGSQLDGGFGGTGWLGDWAVASARGADVTVESVALSYASGFVVVNGGAQAMQYLATEDGISQMFGRQLPAQAGDVLYLSFLYRNTVDVGPSSSDFWQFGFDTTSLPEPRASILDRNTEFQGRAGSTNTFAATPTPITSVTNQTYFLVLKLEKTGGSSTYNAMTFFVDPTTTFETAGDGSSSINTGLDLAAAAHLGIRKAFTDAGDTYHWDELRVGTTWGEVVPAPNDPPVATDDSLTAAEDGPAVSVNPAANDSDP